MCNLMTPHGHQATSGALGDSLKCLNRNCPQKGYDLSHVKERDCDNIVLI